MWVTIVLGGVILGFCGAAATFVVPAIRKQACWWNSIAIGHFNCIGYAFSVAIGKLFAKKKNEGEKEAEELPRVLQKLFKDFVFSVAFSS